MGKIEYRKLKEFRVEDQGDGKPKIVDGHAALFEHESKDLGFIESIEQGAFDGHLEDDVIAAFNHKEDYVLARVSNKSLKLEIDKKGLRYTFELDEDLSYGKDLRIQMDKGLVTESSFAFTVKRDEWSEGEDGTIYRKIIEIDELFDVSLVTRPAYGGTSVGLRSLQETIEAGKKILEERKLNEENSETKEGGEEKDINNISSEMYRHHTEIIKLRNS